MSIKKVGLIDAYGAPVYKPTGDENTVDDSEFEVTVDDAGIIKWLQADLSTWSATPHAFSGVYAAAAGHVLVGFATPTPPNAARVVVVRGFHNDAYGDGSNKRLQFFAEPFLVQTVDLDDIDQNVDDEHIATRAHVTTEADQVQTVVDAIRATDVPAIQQNVDDEAAATRTLVQNETDAIDDQLADMAGPTFNPATDSLEGIHDDVAAFQSDFDSFETVNQGEHDATQSAIAEIGNAARARLLLPNALTVPDSGSNVYKLRFLYRDTSADPATLENVDSIDSTTLVTPGGGAPAGVSVGAWTNVRTGVYEADLTVQSTAPLDTQVLITVAFTKNAQADEVNATVMLVDLDPQLARIEAQVNAVRNTDVPNIQQNIDDEHVATRTHVTAEVDAAEAVIQAHRDEVEPELDELVSEVGDETDLSTAPTVFGRIKKVDENVDAEASDTRTHVTDEVDDVQAVVDTIRATDVPAIQANVDQEGTDTRSLVQSETDAIDQDLADIKGTGFVTAEDSLAASKDEHDATQQAIADLNDPDAAAIADAVWDEPKAGHVAAGSMGEEVQSHATPTEVKTQADQALTDYDPPTRAEATADKAEVIQNTDDEHATTRAHITSEADANEGKLDSIIASLGDGTYGLSALNADLDAILARFGITTDTGGTTTAGTAMAKLNAIMALAEEIEDEVIGPSEKVEPHWG